jgi:hypothetical protein
VQYGQAVIVSLLETIFSKTIDYGMRKLVFNNGIDFNAIIKIYCIPLS